MASELSGGNAPKRRAFTGSVSEQEPDVVIPEEDLKDLDERILALQDNPPGKEMQAGRIIDGPYRCGCCNALRYSSKMFSCDSCNETVCANCINLSPEKAVCDRCVEKEGLPEGSIKPKDMDEESTKEFFDKIGEVQKLGSDTRAFSKLLKR